MSAQRNPSHRRRAPAVAEVAVAPPAPVVERVARVAAVAYFLAEKRGFAPGHELDDWLMAEAEVARGEQRPSASTVIQSTSSGSAT